MRLFRPTIVEGPKGLRPDLDCLRHFKDSGIFPMEAAKVKMKNIAEKTIAPVKNIGPDAWHWKASLAENLDYRSSMDSPYSGNNVFQNNIRIGAEAEVFGRFPVNFSLTENRSNSQYFKNFSAFSIGFDRGRFLRKAEELARQRSKAQEVADLTPLQNIKHSINEKERLLKEAESWLKDPGTIQSVVEEKERAWETEGKLPGGAPRVEASLADTGKALGQLRNNSGERAKKVADTLVGRQPFTNSIGSFSNGKTPAKPDSGKLARAVLEKGYLGLGATYERKKEKARLLRYEIADLRKSYADGLEKMETAKRMGAIFPPEAIEPGKVYGPKQSGLFSKKLLLGNDGLQALRVFSIGRAPLAFSELTANNVSINGVQAEYNPGYYVAAAIGGVDYPSRDFASGKALVAQRANIFRAGLGLKQGNHVYATCYFGDGRASIVPAGKEPTLDKVLGYSMEGNFQLPGKCWVRSELAWSSSPGSLRVGTDGKNKASSSGMSAAGVSINIEKSFLRTGPKVTAKYRRIGPDFRSYTFFTPGAEQLSWALQLEQPLWKKTVVLTGSVQRNAFVRSAASVVVNAVTVLQSYQAVFRKRKWPLATFGFFPAKISCKIGDSLLQESANRVVMGSLAHSYRFFRCPAVSSVLFNVVSGPSLDSTGRGASNSNLVLDHSLFMGKAGLRASLSFNTNSACPFLVFEKSVNWALSKYFSTMVGTKYMHWKPNATDRLGYSLSTVLTLEKVGQLQCSFDHGFLSRTGAGPLALDFFKTSFIKQF